MISQLNTACLEGGKAGNGGKEKMKRAAIYARVSRAYKEDDERTTIESQISDCEEYCRKRGYIVVQVYIEKDKYHYKGKLVNPSGARKDRPQYQKMIRAALNHEFEVIIAWKEDRLYRGMYAALPLAELLDENRDISVELIQETFDFKMLGIKAAIAKIELDNIRDRMVRGRRAKLERGEVPGGVARYGYFKNENNSLEIYEEEARIVRKIYDWYIQGVNSMEIRRRLNALGVPPRVNKIWSKASIHNILYFEGYATGEYTTAIDGDVYTIQCPPIISMEIYHKAMETRQANKTHRSRNVKEDYLCRGIVYCPCGWKWNVRTCRSGQSRYTAKYGYYGCARKDHQAENVHPDCPGTIGSKRLDDYVWNFVVNLCHNPEILQDAIDAKIQKLLEEQSDIEAEAESLQRELDTIANERQWVITQNRKGRITDEDADLQLGALHFQSLELRKRHSESLAALAAWSQAERLKEWTASYLRNIEKGIDVLNTPPGHLPEDIRGVLYDSLGAALFEEKFNGDQNRALEWAILEEKRRIVRTLLSRVLVVKGKNGEKLVIPQLALEIPPEFASLVYDDQSLAYIEQARNLRIEEAGL